MNHRLLALALIILPLSILGAATTADPSYAVMKELSWRETHAFTNYSYVVTETAENHAYEYRVNRIGPCQTRNLLLTVNGRPSNEMEIRKFTVARDSYSDDPSVMPKTGDINRWIVVGKPASIIVPGTLKVKATLGDQQYFTFTARTSVGGSTPVDLDGTLVYDSKESYVTTIELKSRPAIFKAGDGTKVEAFTIRMTFERNIKLRAIVLSGVTWSVKGRKGFLSSFDEEYSAGYSDYRTDVQ